MGNDIWGDAHVTYCDMAGTAQLDWRKAAGTIEDVVGLDRDEWLAVGLEIGGGENHLDLHVLAVSAHLVPEGGDVFPKIAEANAGEIPVTDFLVHDVDPFEFLQQVTHVFDLRLRSRGARDLPIRVVSAGDIPD